MFYSYDPLYNKGIDLPFKIYNEEVRDLLNMNNKDPLNVREDASGIKVTEQYLYFCPPSSSHINLTIFLLSRK